LQVRASDGALLWERALTVTQLGAQTHKPTGK